MFHIGEYIVRLALQVNTEDTSIVLPSSVLHVAIFSTLKCRRCSYYGSASVPKWPHK